MPKVLVLSTNMTLKEFEQCKEIIDSQLYYKVVVQSIKLHQHKNNKKTFVYTEVGWVLC